MVEVTDAKRTFMCSSPSTEKVNGRGLVLAVLYIYVIFLLRSRHKGQMKGYLLLSLR